MNIRKLGHQSQSLVQLTGQSLATVTQHGHPQVVVAGQEDVPSRVPRRMGGECGGLHRVEDEGGAEVDVGDHQEDVEDIVIVQNRTINLSI